MNQLWSPWRMEYIENNNKEEGCVFCTAQAMDDGSENLIAHRGKRAYVILACKYFSTQLCTGM